MNRVLWLALVFLGLTTAQCLAQSKDAPSVRPKVWAIVIGIDRYDDVLIPPSVGSMRDARAVAGWFVGTAGWGERQVLRMDDLSQKSHGAVTENLTDLRPTKANLNWVLNDWLGHRVKKDDLVVLFFAGQATSRPPHKTSAAGRSYVLPIDASAVDIEQTGWSIDDALDQSKAIIRNKCRVVIWLDTSPQGRGPHGLAIEKGAPSTQDWLSSLTRWPGVTAWIASDGRSAPEPIASGPSRFVTTLLKAMGTREQAHNLRGCLQAMNDDSELVRRGFQSMGGVGPTVSLWSGGAQVVEEAVPELVVQSGHGDRVTAVLVSADNAHAITASEDSTVRIWSLADRSLLRVLTDPMVGVEAMALDGDGSVLIAGDGLGRIFGWDLKLDRPKPFYGPAGQFEGIRDIAFLPGSQRFVTRDKSQVSILWDASAGAIRKLRVFSDEPLSHLVSVSRPDPAGAALVGIVEPLNGKTAALVAFDHAGNAVGRFAATMKRISAVDLASDGRRIAMGDSGGNVRILEFPGWKPIYEGSFEGTIHLVRFVSARWLIVADSRSLRLVETKPGFLTLSLIDPQGLEVGGEIDRAAFSKDGRWLAVCTPEGRVLVWRLSEGKRPEPLIVPQAESLGLSLAFSPDGRTLVIGGSDGSLRSWSLPAPDALGALQSRPTIPPARGKVASLVPSPSGRFLLEVTKDDLAIVWDLEEGRGCKLLPGRWIGGAFLTDESKLAMLQRPDHGGEILVVDRITGETQATRFERPSVEPGRPSNVAFGRIIASKSGKWVAAASLEGQEPLACVWSAATGKASHWLREHENSLTAIDFSGDELFLMTASQDGRVKIWPLVDPKVELRTPSLVLVNPDADAPPISSARFCPGRPGLAVVGTRGGFVFLWDWEKYRTKPKRIEVGRIDGEVNAVTFSNDGKWVAASGSREKSIRFWTIGDNGGAVYVPFQPRPHHAEQVGSLVAWPNGSIIISGGDDATIRFWDLKANHLIGSLLAQTRDEKSLDWLAFTPTGLFDGSLPGEAMLKWRVGEKIVTLSQSQDIHHVFQLAGAFPIGEKIKAPELTDESPQLKIDTPKSDRVVNDRQVELILWTGDADPAALRLYQNDVPIRGSGDFEPGDGPNFLKAKVTLSQGENSFYAMASKPGAIDGRTETRTIRYEGVDPPGRVHTLAIGVSQYARRPLKYAHSDAMSIADLLVNHQIQGNNLVGERVVLLDNQVTIPNIENAFRRIQDAVRGRPQDTVVLFVAGHTDTDSRNEQFCLLLPGFSFEGAVPLIPDVANEPLRVATRGNIGGGSFVTRVGDPGVLPYVVLYNRLSRLEALQRLIIVDACQAAAILDDPAVRNIQRLVENGSRKSRNSYLLAARRGEPANEADALKHGLLTYTLLTGLKAPGLERVPQILGGFPGEPSADLNRDGIVTTDELVSYTSETLPKLARLFPQLVMRAGGQPPIRNEQEFSGSPELEAKVKFQSSDSSFPLIELPR